MHLHRGAAQRTDAVEQCNTRVGISTGVEYDAVVVEAYLLHLVDELAFYIALEIVNLHVGEQCFQCGQIALKRVLAVDARLTHTEQVEVGSVDNLYLSHGLQCFCYAKIVKTSGIRK